MNWKIRAAQLHDADRLIEFNCAIARETEDKELPIEIVRRGVQRGLAQPNEVSYWVAELAPGESHHNSGEHTPSNSAAHELQIAADQAQLIGCLMLTREWSDWRDGWLMWVQSVYVCEPYRGQGVFRSLLETVIDRMRQTPDVVGLRLYVETENERAQAVYYRTGFVDSHYKVLEQIF